MLVFNQRGSEFLSLTYYLECVCLRFQLDAELYIYNNNNNFDNNNTVPVNCSLHFQE